jgi:hypothetical protein
VSPRVAAAGLWALAALLYLGVALPGRQALPGVQQGLLRVQDEGARLRARLLEMERHETARARMATTFAAASAARADVANELRQSLVTVLDGSSVTDVRLSVTQAEPPVAAQARISAAGSLVELTRLAGRLARPGGLVLEEVRLSPTPSGVSLKLDAIALEPRR